MVHDNHVCQSLLLTLFETAVSCSPCMGLADPPVFRDSPVFTIYLPRIRDDMLHIWLLYEFLWFELRSLCLHAKCSYPLSHLPRPHDCSLGSNDKRLSKSVNLGRLRALNTKPPIFWVIYQTNGKFHAIKFLLCVCYIPKDQTYSPVRSRQYCHWTPALIMTLFFHVLSYEMYCTSQAWWHMPVTSAFGRWSRKIVAYSETAWATNQDAVSKTTNKGVCEMDQQVKVPAAKTNDPSSVSGNKR